MQADAREVRHGVGVGQQLARVEHAVRRPPDVAKWTHASVAGHDLQRDLRAKGGGGTRLGEVAGGARQGEVGGLRR